MGGEEDPSRLGRLGGWEGDLWLQGVRLLRILRCRDVRGLQWGDFCFAEALEVKTRRCQGVNGKQLYRKRPSEDRTTYEGQSKGF